jgi:hypothetical protein
MLQAGRLWVQVQEKSLNFFTLLNPSSCTMALGFTQLLTEMNTRRSFWGKAWLVHKADNFTTI